MLILAHRGARRVEPENTLAAFAAARRLGADGVELDVHSTADGALVVHHDPDIEGSGLICEMPLEEFRQAAPFAPTLKESLDLLGGLLTNIEIKNSPIGPAYDKTCGTSDRVVEALAARRSEKIEDRVLVSSFDLGSINRVRELDSSIPTGLLTAGVDSVKAINLAADNGHSGWNPHLSALADRPADIVLEAHARNLQVFVWTVNEPIDMKRVSAAGVDVLITDVPDVAVQAMAE